MLGPNRPGSRDSPCIHHQRDWSAHLGIILKIWRAYYDFYRDIHSENWLWSLYLPNMRCIFDKNPNLKKIQHTPRDEYNGELITNTNNSTNIRQNF
jgi:hypothetical protein